MKIEKNFKRYKFNLSVTRYAFRVNLLRFAPDYRSAFIWFMLNFGYEQSMDRFIGHDLFLYIDVFRKYEPGRRAFGWCKRFEK